jgi:hypothetical protein
MYCAFAIQIYLLQIGVIDNQKLERGAAVQWIHQLKKPWSVPYYFLRQHRRRQLPDHNFDD